MIVDVGTGSRSNSGDDNMIPLINVVFLMLIFFMIAGQIAKTDALETSPPTSINDRKFVAAEVIELLVSADGALFVDDQPVNRKALTEVLARHVDQVEDIDQLRVRIKADAGLPVSELKLLLSRVREAGLVKASLVTRLQPGDAS